MRKWIILSGLLAVCHIGICNAVELKINLPDELTPYVQNIVNKTNEENAKNEGYVPIDIRQYCENILISAANSWKEQQEKARLEKLRDMLLSLPVEKQNALVESLKTAVGE